MSQGHTVLSANNLSAEPRLAYPTMVNIVSERSSCVICGIRSTSTLNCLQTKTFAFRAQFTHYSNSFSGHFVPVPHAWCRAASRG